MAPELSLGESRISDLAELALSTAEFSQLDAIFMSEDSFDLE